VAPTLVFSAPRGTPGPGVVRHGESTTGRPGLGLDILRRSGEASGGSQAGDGRDRRAVRDGRARAARPGRPPRV